MRENSKLKSILLVVKNYKSAESKDNQLESYNPQQIGLIVGHIAIAYINYIYIYYDHVFIYFVCYAYNLSQ